MMTDHYAVIGNPISHTKSPLIHGLFAQAAQQDMEYTAIEGPVEPDTAFADAVRAFAVGGGKGVNVTAPFKLKAFAMADERSERATLAGAANALKFEVGRILADNFDGIGLVRDIEINLGLPMAGKRVLLANKEALVMSGALFMDAVRQHGATVLPIDSEHNAIFQCLPQQAPKFGHGVSRIVLTASGGPFRTRAVDTLADVTPDQACAHPNWVMGRKISVDSATMMNKGLEVIEAYWLFGVPVERLEVLIHPQSVIHSMVGYDDGSVLAQLGNPDMRTPIAYGLAHPERIEAGVPLLDLAATGTLTFEAPDLRRFPCLALAFDALRAGGTAPAVLNAANEVAVDAFLQRRIRFTDIAAVVGDTLARASIVPADSLDTVFAADAQARGQAERYIATACAHLPAA